MQPEVWGPVIAGMAPEEREPVDRQVTHGPHVAPPIAPPPPPDYEDYRRPSGLPQGSLSRKLVVARYKEDLGWLREVPFPVVVYNKGYTLRCDLPNVTVVDRPNTGREAETYLHHLAADYDSLPDLTFLCQGWPFPHGADFLDRLVHDYTAPTGLSTQYLDSIPDDATKAKDRVEEHFGHTVRYGDALAQYHGHLTPPSWFDPAAWEYVFASPMPKPLWFSYAALWAVPRASIRARPRAFWRWLGDECGSGADGQSWTTPPINPWTMEALWFSLFNPSVPIRWPRATPPRNRTREAMARPPRRGGCCGGSTS